ncbi:MAG: hypothetical protein AB7Q42_09015 [Acidimicrobiia bacterium]
MGRNMKRATVLAVGAVLALSACGGDDDEVSGGATEELPSATDSGAAGTDAPDGTVASDNTAGDIELDGEFCAATAQMMERFDDVENAESSDDPMAGLSDMFASLGEIGGALDDLEGKAPDELKDDVATLAEAFSTFEEHLPELQQFSEDMQAAGSDPAKLQEVLTKYQDLMTTLDMSAIDSAEVEQAGENINTYVTEVCGIDIGS